MSSDVSSDVEMLYQEYDRALEEIKFKDRELTSKMKDIHVWFKAAQSTCEKIERYNERARHLSEARTNMFKATKKEIRKVRDNMKDLFVVLFVQGWTQEAGP